MSLTGPEQINGIVILIIVIYTLLIGLYVISKYLKEKQVLLLYLGVLLILLSRSNYPVLCNFVLISLNFAPLPDVVYIFIMDFIQIVMILWLKIFTKLMHDEQKQKLILRLYLIYEIVFTVIFLYLMFTDSTLVGSVEYPWTFKPRLFFLIFRMLLTAIIFLATTYLFYRETRGKSPEIRLKGKLILFGLVLFILSGLATSVFNNALISLILLVIGLTFGYYGGFILPKWIKKLFLRNRE